jgi:predicted enzyme related to lactoylglutathione lyase
MIKKVAFTMYPVVDLARARDFYENTLGIKVGNIYEHPGGSWVEYDLPQGGCFAITTLAQGVKPSATSGGSIAFEVEDLKTMLEDLKKKNVKLAMDTLVTEGVCSMAVILDSEGNAITLHQLNKK